MALIHEPVVAGVVVFFFERGIQRDMPHVHLTPTLSCVSIPSVMHEEGFASIMEHCGAYAPLLHAFVEYHIPTTLPMKRFMRVRERFRKTYTLPSLGQRELLRTRMLRGSTPLRRSTARVNNRNLSLSFKLNLI